MAKNERERRRRAVKAGASVGAALLLAGLGGQAGRADAGMPSAVTSSAVRAEAVVATHPNILFILCDDLGYGDLSCFGQAHFQTPNLDHMVAEGMRLTQHYCASPVCAPSRASLMLGIHGGNSPVRDHQFDREIPDTITLASALKQAGYRTLSVGKWGLGGKPAQGFPAHPQKRGFDAWYGLYTHNAGHVHYPDAEHPLFDGYKDVTADVTNAYSTDLYTAKAKQWITEQVHDRPNQPFFLYLAYIAPHEAFNIPDGLYPTGGGLNGGVQWPLVTHPDNKNKWIFPDFRTATYQEGDDPKATPQPWTWQMKHYATMVHRIDDAVGDLLQTLKDLKIDNNTLIVFTSDNGPAYDDGLHPSQLKSWGPLDGFKRDVFEGGVREPTIVRWPGKVPAGTVDSNPSAHYDWLPTVCDLAGLTPPAESDGLSLLPTLTGHGAEARHHDWFYTEFHGPSNRREDHEVLGRHGYPFPEKTGPGDPWGQQQSIHIGDFVGLRAQTDSVDTPLRLYDVVKDPHEDHDLAADPAQAPLLARMRDLFAAAHRPQAGNPRPYDTAVLSVSAPKSETVAGLHWRAYRGTWPWSPDVRTLKPDAEGTSATLDLNAPLGGKPGAVEFTGYINAPSTGVYRLTLNGGLSAHLWLQDSHVLNTEADKIAPDRSDTVSLAAGWHPIRILLVTDGKSDEPRLLWNLPADAAGPEQPIPASVLAHTGGN